MFAPMSTTTENARFQNETQERVMQAAQNAPARRSGLNFFRRIAQNFKAPRLSQPKAQKQASRA